MTTNFEKELDEFLTLEIKQNELAHDQLEESTTKPNLKRDAKNIALLIFLYMLQGIPLGLSASIPFLLGARKVSYSEQVFLL